MEERTHMDRMGRVYLPARVRKATGIRRGDPVAFAVDGDRIVIARYEPHCVFCQGPAEATFRDRPVCAACWAGLAARARPDPVPYVVFADAAPVGGVRYRAAAVAEDGRWTARHVRARSQTEAEGLALVLASGLAQRYTPAGTPVVLVTDNRWFRLDYHNPRQPALSRCVAACRKILAGRPVAVAYVPGPRNPADPLSRMAGGPQGEQVGPPLPVGFVAAYRAG